MTTLISDMPDTAKKDSNSPNFKNDLPQIIGISGLILGLLVNAIVTIKFDNYPGDSLQDLKETLLVSTFFFGMCIFSSVVTYLFIPHPKFNRFFGFVVSVGCFLAGFSTLLLSIPKILFPDDSHIFSIFLILFVIGVIAIFVFSFKK